MADQSNEKLNQVDKSAAEVLLESISHVGGEETDVLVIVQNKADGRFTVLSNCTKKDGHWLLTKASYTVLAGLFEEEN